MHQNLTEIKRLRKKHELTQANLAKLAGVSQSIIAKIEASNIDPTYTKVQKIFDVLYSLEKKKEPKAEEFMSKKIIFVKRTDFASDAVAKMKKNNISQLPVMDKDMIVGLVGESTIVDALYKGKHPEKTRIYDIMEESPPILTAKTPLRIVLELLRYSPLVVISDKGKMEGVITKADVIK